MSSFERCVVLVADDDPAVLKLVTYALSQHGYEVIPATDGPMALCVCEERSGPIHLALLDVIMPGMTGPKLFESLLNLHPKIEVLFMSGSQQESLLPRAIKDAQLIDKPFYPRDLVQRVNAILGNSDDCALLDDVANSALAVNGTH
jgi:DNA-binding response OmpR family regulator